MATAKISRIVSDFETSLSGAISIGDTSFTIQSATDLDGTELSDGTYCFTIDRDNTDAKEYLVGQLDASEKTVSSVSSVSRQGVLTANAQIAHRVGSNVIISDHSILSSLSRVFNGVDTIDPASPIAYTSNPTLSSAGQIATKGYVDSVVTGGTVNTDRVILGSQTAGETVAEGDIVYFKSSDSRWWLADADLTSTFQNVQLGIAQGAGTAGNAIADGVLIYGKSDNFTGLTATATYYLSNTAGAVATSAGTSSVIIGQAFDTTGIFFNPSFSETQYAVNATTGAGDAGKLIKTDSSGLLDNTFLRFQETVLYQDVTASTSSSIGSTVVYTQDLADAFTTNTGIRIRFGAKLSCVGGVSPGTPSVTFTLDLEGTTLYSVSVGEDGGTSILNYEGILINQGTLNSQTLFNYATLPNFASIESSTSSKTIDTSGTPTLTLTASNGHNSTRNIWDYYYMIIEKIA